MDNPREGYWVGPGVNPARTQSLSLIIKFPENPSSFPIPPDPVDLIATLLAAMDGPLWGCRDDNSQMEVLNRLVALGGFTEISIDTLIEILLPLRRRTRNP
jgi:hypothetical protein